jgi:hypothetical protein
MVGILFLTGTAFGQAPTLPPTNCRNSVQGDNSGNLTNNCGNVYLHPPLQRNTIYQQGREIANIDGPLEVKNDGTCFLKEVYNTKLDAIDQRQPLELNGWLIIITKATPFAQAEATATGMRTNVLRDVECKILN